MKFGVWVQKLASYVVKAHDKNQETVHVRGADVLCITHRHFSYIAYLLTSLTTHVIV